ncbi:MAG: DUF3352 domain-containing protein, partial [Acidobacteriota bacterium]|nr:DUF3352 domain-containing protein [Acidobacteriota bacterium]
AIEEMLAADGYGIYAEVRRVGVLARSEELRTAVGMLGLVGAEETRPLSELFNFVSENSEALAEARAVMAFMPTRAGLPQALVALEMPTQESAAAFEPKFRREIGQQYETVENALSGQAGPTSARGTLKAAAGDAGDRGAPAGMTEKGAVSEKSPSDAAEKGEPGAGEKGAPGAASEKASARGAAQKSVGPASFVRRFGRLLLAAESPFTLRRLRGEEGAPALSENARFQSVRARFASDSVFVYVDTTLAQQGYAVEQQRQLEARAAGEKQTTGQYDVKVRKAEESPVAQPSTETVRVYNSEGLPKIVNPVGVQTAEPTRQAGATETPTTNATPTTGVQPTAPTVVTVSPAPTESDTRAAIIVSAPTTNERDSGGGGSPALTAKGIEGKPTITISKPSEEQVTVQRMSGIMSGLFEGTPRIPGAVALGLSLDSGTLSVRVAVENTPDGVVSLIPFLPNLIAGPPVTADAAQVAPADCDIFFATSLDWTQIYNTTLGAASLNPERLVASWEMNEEGEYAVSRPSANEKVPTAEEAVAAVEKLFGFSFKQDLLPSLGNEIAVSAPLNSLVGGSIFREPADKKEEKDAEPGVVVIVSLNSPDKVRQILPRALAALGFVPLGASQLPPEKREGFEIHSLGAHSGLSYGVIDNFLVLSEEVKAVRYVVDAYAARRTLAAADSYRDSTAWQAQQKLAQVYISESVMRATAENTKRDSGGSTDPVVRGLLAQLDSEPRPASYEVTNEGDVLVHELHLPLSLIRVYALSALITVKDAPVLGSERMTVFALDNIADAEREFKDEKKKERYGTLEELFGEKLLEPDLLARLGYRIELSAAGDHFEAAATPKNYGKTGRRSFFVNEDATVRGADHKGRPASAEDPPVN